MSLISDQIYYCESRIDELENKNRELTALLRYFFTLVKEKEFNELKKEMDYFRVRL